MASFKKISPLMLASLPFLLTACGDGWVPQPYHGVPYDGERTAGTGVQYVLDHMAPARDVNVKPETDKVKVVEPQAPAPAPKAEEPEVELSSPPADEPETKSADDVFSDKQKK